MIRAFIDGDEGELQVLGTKEEVLCELVDISKRVLSVIEGNYNHQSMTEKEIESLHFCLVNTYIKILKNEMGVI